MTLLSTKKRDRFFVLKKNHQFEEFYTIEDAFSSKDRYVVIIDKFKEFQIPKNDVYWRISEFIFLDDIDKPIKLSKNSWTIHEIDTSYKSTGRTEFDLTLSDPSNKIRRLKFKLAINRGYNDASSNDLQLIETAISTLDEYSKYHNWEQIDLKQENTDLKEKIKELEYTIHNLNNSFKK